MTVEYEKTQPLVKEKQIGDQQGAGDLLEKSYLVAMTGPHAGTVFTLQQGEMVAGRTPETDIFLQDHQVSRKHAQFTVLHGETQINDLGSTNGTFVNGKKLSEEVSLSDGDEVQIGATNFRFSIHNPIDGNKLGLNNHGYFETRLQEELDRAARYNRNLSVLMIGPSLDPAEVQKHSALLSQEYPQVVQYLQNIIRTMDLLAHFGKYELELILPETDKTSAIQLAERISNESQFNKDITLSVGIANFPEDGSTADLIIERSRKALKQARASKGSSPVVQHEEEPRRIMLTGQKEIIVRSEKMKELFDVIERISKSNITVLVQGETGVGKEVVAEATHSRSNRSDKPLVCINCAAITETLLESELFGHEKGAFTGADQRKIGLFETAQGGTIFLDEIGEMPLKTQAKLLRVLQEKTIMRIGSNKEISIDVRVVAATNRKLEEQVAQNLFREDLFYRLNAATLTIPPLRERKEEIPYLSKMFVKTCCEENGFHQKTLSPEAMDLLMNFSWPGNIRELKNTIERSVIISEGDTIFKESLSSKLTSEDSMPAMASFADMGSAPGVEGNDTTVVGDMKEVIAAYERDLIINALKKVNWNQTKAADLLNVPRRTLVSKIKKYDIAKD
ncbi:MAG: sigma 54-interacting transcriptional regulator [Deltaproteobacteria bacterium]|nr:sigma 54-interacting transcriptional regulator [Deltaproteobacteria bacterium]